MTNEKKSLLMLVTIGALLIALPLFVGTPAFSQNIDHWFRILEKHNIAPVPQTGQTYSDEAGDRDDGDLRMGVEWPVPRFIDNGNGTVTDKLTNLVWLKNADCFGNVNWNINWYDALIYCNTLQTGFCDLSDNSLQGDWRLPNRNELLSLIDIRNLNTALPDGHPFINVREDYYWTSSTAAFNPSAEAWYLYMYNGSVHYKWKHDTTLNHVWPVRSGK